MTTQRLATAWLLGLAFTAGPRGLAAQEYAIPDSLARLGLPGDPGDVPRLVATRGLPIYHVFRVGCPSDGGWAAAAFAALEEAAETDSIVRSKLAGSFGTRVLSGDMCPSDLPYVSELITRYYPDEMKGRGIGGTTTVQLQVDEAGKVTKVRVHERSGNGHFDAAALKVARRLNYSPALMCNKPVRDVAKYTLTFFPSRGQQARGAVLSS